MFDQINRNGKPLTVFLLTENTGSLDRVEIVSAKRQIRGDADFAGMEYINLNV